MKRKATENNPLRPSHSVGGGRRFNRQVAISRTVSFGEERPPSNKKQPITEDLECSMVIEVSLGDLTRIIGIALMVHSIIRLAGSGGFSGG